MEHIEHQSVILKDGTVTSLGWDDIEHMDGNVPDAPKIVTGDSIYAALTDVPEAWIRSRVRGWMESNESPGQDFWIGTYIGKQWVFCASREDSYAPLMHRIEYARNVCRYLNRECSHGGVWLTGWIRGGGEFYCLWKDSDGDIAIPLECNVPFVQLIGWSMEDWAEHAEQAHALWAEREKQMELSSGQQKKLAQGEPISPNHLAEAPPIGI